LKPEWWGSHWLKRRSTREKRKPVTRNDNNNNNNNNSLHGKYENSLLSA
jgi:hypothetical protein